MIDVGAIKNGTDKPKLENSYELRLFGFASVARANLKEGWIVTDTLHQLPITNMLDAEGEATTDPSKCSTFVAGSQRYGWGAFIANPEPTFH